MAAPVHADRFPPLDPARVALWQAFPKMGTDATFASLVGLELEEVRLDYGRMRLRYRPELNQPAGVVHGGAVATLIDTCVVPAVASAYDERPRMLTVNLVVQFLGAVVGQDAIAEGFVVKRGRSTVFCRAEVRVESGDLVATGDLVYNVRPSG